MGILISFALAILFVGLIVVIGFICIKVIDFVETKFGYNILVVGGIILLIGLVTFLVHMIRN